MKISELLDSLPEPERSRLLGRIEGMQLAQRICKNRGEDMAEAGPAMTPYAAAHDCATTIRFVQVSIGNGQMPFGDLTADELDAVWRIY